MSSRLSVNSSWERHRYSPVRAVHTVVGGEKTLSSRAVDDKLQEWDHGFSCLKRDV